MTYPFLIKERVTNLWARLGYSLEEAGKLAENTMVLMNVSEFDDVSEATDSMISAIQAFKDQGMTDVGDFSMDIIDVFNQIGNNYAISTSDLADSLTRSSASLVAANNTLEQAVALTTAANTTIQNPEVVGTTLKTLSMRIRGVKTELEEAGEDTEGMIVNTSKLQAKVQALTNVDGKGGVNILTNSGEFKSTYDILLEISKVWGQMNDMDQAALLEIIAGKRAGSVVAGILQNGDILESAYNDAMNADGSAMNELNTYLDSIQGKLDQLSNSTQTMWMNFMNSEIVKFFIDLANVIVKVVDAINPLNAAVGLFAAKTAFKSDSFGQFFKLDQDKHIVRNKKAKKGAAETAKAVDGATNPQALQPDGINVQVDSAQMQPEPQQNLVYNATEDIKQLNLLNDAADAANKKIDQITSGQQPNLADRMLGDIDAIDSEIDDIDKRIDDILFKKPFDEDLSSFFDDPEIQKLEAERAELYAKRNEIASQNWLNSFTDTDSIDDAIARTEDSLSTLKKNLESDKQQGRDGFLPTTTETSLREIGELETKLAKLEARRKEISSSSLAEDIIGDTDGANKQIDSITDNISESQRELSGAQNLGSDQWIFDEPAIGEEEFSSVTQNAQAQLDNLKEKGNEIVSSTTESVVSSSAEAIKAEGEGLFGTFEDLSEQASSIGNDINVAPLDAISDAANAGTESVMGFTSALTDAGEATTELGEPVFDIPEQTEVPLPVTLDTDDISGQIASVESQITQPVQVPINLGAETLNEQVANMQEALVPPVAQGAVGSDLGGIVEQVSAIPDAVNEGQASLTGLMDTLADSGAAAMEAADGMDVMQGAQTKQVAAATGATGANAANAASETAVGTAGTLASFGVNLLNAALSMLASIGIGLAITAIIKGLDALIETASETKEKVQELTKTYKDAKEELSENIDILTTSGDSDKYDTLLDEFEELTKGVNKFGENLSLTADEYQRYKDICEKIVGVNPSLVDGYDSATSAIGNNAGALRELIELQKEEARLNAAEYVSYGAHKDNGNFEKVAKNALNDFESAQNGLNKATTSYGGSRLSQLFYDGYTTYGSDSKRYEANAREIMSVLGYSPDEIESAISSSYTGTAFGKSFNFKTWFDTYAIEISNNRKKLIDELKSRKVSGDELSPINYSDLDDEQDKLKWNEIIDSNIDELDSFGSSVDDYLDAVENAQNGMIDAYLQIPYALREYDELSTGEQSFITEWIKNSDMFKIDENTTQDDILKAKQVIINTVKDIAGGDYVTDIDGVKVSSKTILDQMFSIDDSDVSYGDYIEQLKGLIGHLWDAIGGDANTLGFADKNALALSLGLEFVLEEDTEDDNTDKLVARIAELTGKSEKEVREYMDSLPAIQVTRAIEYNLSGGYDDNQTNSRENPVTLEDVFGEPNPNYTQTPDTKTVSTYSELSDRVSNYNDILEQTNAIAGDNIEVTEDYKQSLKDLGATEEELGECFDENNEFVVKNSAALRKLVKEKTKEIASDTKLAKAQSQLEYYDLVKQLGVAVKGLNNYDDATMDSIKSTLEQIDVVKQAIYQLQLLEDQLLGTTNAFKNYKQAQEIDAANTYGDDYVSMAQTMYDAFYKTGQVGTEANWAAIEALVPDSVYAGLMNDADKMKAIYDYFNNNILPTLTLEEDQLSLGFENINDFVEKGLASGVFTGDTEKFDLVEGMNLEEAAQLLKMTEAQAYAFFAELDKYNTSGTEQSFLSQLDDSLSGDIMEVTNKMDELNRQKLALLEDGVTDQERGQLGYINWLLDKQDKKLKELGSTAYNTWQEYTQNDAALQSLSEIEDKQRMLTSKQLQTLGIQLDEGQTMTVQQAYDYLLAKQLELEEPTVLTAQLAIETIDGKINTLESALDSGDYSSVDPVLVDLEVGQVPTKEDIETKIQSLKEDKVVIASTFGIELTEEEKASLDEQLNAIEEFTINDKTFSVIANGTSETMDALQAIQAFSIANKSYTVTEHRVIQTSNGSVLTGSQSTHTTGGGRYAKVDGTAHSNGTAYSGGNWGASESDDNALVGELGTEILVRNGRWRTIGENGAEFTQVKKGDIIFNHKQTEELLKNGHVTGRGRAYAEGSAYSGLWGPTSPNESVSNTSGSEIGNAASALSNAANSVSESAEEFLEVFDWIEVRIEEINERLSLKSAQLENTVGYTNQNAIIDDMIELNQNLYDNLTAGAARYNEYSAQLLAKIPAAYREAAQDGSIAIEAFTGEVGEETLNAIQEYREWVQKGADATQQAEEVLTEIANLAKQAIDNIAAEYENKTSIPGIKLEQLEAYNSLLETDLGSESAAIYKKMIAVNNQQIKLLQQQRNKMQAELNAQVEAGNIKKYSQAWYDAVNEIAAVDTEIINLTVDTENYQDAINELHWEHFDNLMSRFEAISDEANNLIDILSSKDLVDPDTGEWTDEGVTSLGLYAQQMEVAEMQAKKYKEEINYLNKNWKKLGYTEQEYLDKLNELKSGQYEAIQSYNDTKEAIKDLTAERVEAIKKGIEEEIDAYSELIEKKKEELDAEKDLHDFQKSVEDQQKNIADIERKLAALSSDNSASARAQRAQLQAELAEAQAELEDMYYDRSITDQQNALDQELSNFQEDKEQEMEDWDEYLENTEQVVSDALATVQSNTDVVYQTLQSMGQEYSLSIADALTSPWEDGKNAIQKYSEKFKLSMSSTVEELRSMADEYKRVMAEIENAGKIATNQVSTNENIYKNNMPFKKLDRQSDTPKNTIKVGGKVNAGNAKIYDYAGDKTGEKQYYSKDPVYTVLKIDGNWVQVRHKSMKSGVAGWFKKSDLKAYAKGTLGTKKDELAWIDEQGLEELVMHAGPNGRLQYLSKGTSVIPSDISENLMKLGQLDPQDVLDRNRPQIAMSPSIVNNTMEISIDASVGELIHVETLNGNNPAEVTKIVDKAWDKYMKELNAQIRRYVNR